jgi:hypothetical protein
MYVPVLGWCFVGAEHGSHPLDDIPPLVSLVEV